jgi:phosphohistidine phosphatase
MMRLLIVRHAIAVPRGTSGVPDEERPLTPEGRARFRGTARGIAKILGRPDVLLTSPWLRARQTASILAKAWGRVEPVEETALAGGTFEEQAVALDRHRDAGLVAIVGHEPYLSELLARLIGARGGERLELKKGGIALVELDGGIDEGGALRLYLGPGVLRRL